RTLDTVDQFQISSSSLDYISLIQPCSIGDPANQAVWLSLRGSSVLQLWDSHTLTCKMLYDVREDSGYLTPMAAMTTTSAIAESRSDDNVNDTSGSQYSFSTVMRKSTEHLSSSPKSLTDDDTVQDVQTPDEALVNGHGDSSVVDAFASSPENGLGESPDTKSEKASICPVTELCSREARKWSLKTTDSCSAIDKLPGLVKRPSWGNLHYQLLKRRNSSADCLPTWLSRDTLSSSVTSDSYDFDDFFVQYNDDCFPTFRGTQAAVGHASTPAAKVKVPSVYLSVEEKTGALEHFTENDDGGDSTTTHGAATNDWPEVPSYDVSHLSSDLGSNVSFSSIDPPYGYELVLQEKLKISDKAIRSLLELR
ncbi:unnamed protein product, partial [Ixodes pacificus]